MGEVDGIRDGMTYRQVERALRRMGFRVLRHSGDHAIFGLGPRRVAVRQGHPTERVPRHTIRQMALQARGEQPWGWGGGVSMVLSSLGLATSRHADAGPGDGAVEKSGVPRRQPSRYGVPSRMIA